MFEDNEYMQKIQNQFGTNFDVEQKINRMLGKDAVELNEQ